MNYQPGKRELRESFFQPPRAAKRNRQDAFSNAGSYLKDPPLLELSGAKMRPEEAFGTPVGL